MRPRRGERERSSSYSPTPRKDEKEGNGRHHGGEHERSQRGGERLSSYSSTPRKDEKEGTGRRRSGERERSSIPRKDEKEGNEQKRRRGMDDGDNQPEEGELPSDSTAALTQEKKERPNILVVSSSLVHSIYI